jgi:hypothetical protein
MRRQVIALAAALIMAPLGAQAADLVICWQKGSYAQEDEATSRRAAVQRPAPARWTPTQLFIARAALHRIR